MTAEHWLGLVIAAYITGLIGLLWWSIRSSIGRVEQRMGRVETKVDEHQAGLQIIQVDVERRFATWEAHRAMADKVTDHEGRICALEASGGVHGRG